METFNILKRNRKYFAASMANGYKCKILIDANSDGLALGEHELDVDDISVRSKYGVDLIFKLKASVEAQEAAGICSLRHYTYNDILIEKCRDLGGKWDSEEKAWVFSGLVEDEVELLDEQFNSDLIGVELTFKSEESVCCDAIRFCGLKLASASGRDSGAKLGDGVSLISGSVTSGGSVKNWTTRITEGTVLRLQIPAQIIELNTLDCELKTLS